MLFQSDCKSDSRIRKLRLCPPIQNAFSFQESTQRRPKRNSAAHPRQTPALCHCILLASSHSIGITADRRLNHDTSSSISKMSICCQVCSAEISSARTELVVLCRLLRDRWVAYLRASNFGGVFFGIVEELPVIPVSGCEVLVAHRDCS